MKYFKISFAWIWSVCALDFRFPSHQTQSNRSQPRWSDVAIKNTTKIPRILMNFPNCFFSVCRFVWSKCSTHNRILNASDCRIRTQKQSSSIPLSLSTTSQQINGKKKPEIKEKQNSFHSYHFSHFNSLFKYSKYLVSQQKQCVEQRKNQLHLCHRIGSLAESRYMQRVSIINIAVIIFYGFEWEHPAFFLRNT